MGMYGLPDEVVYCRRCVMSNQKPNTSVEHKNTSAERQTIGFTDGICDACAYADHKNEIDWAAREEHLLRVLDKYRRNDGRYDVIVPASGGKDSFYTAHILKTRYGMHPLTVTWAPHIYTDIGWRNLQQMINAGLDNILFTPNGAVHRRLARLALGNLLHPFQPFVFGQKNIGPSFALKYDVPLVMYGESNVEYGDSGADDDDEVMSHRHFADDSPLEEIFLGGVSCRSLIDEHGLSPHDLQPYLPLSGADLEQRQVAVHYLGHYLKWDPQECYYYSVEHGGFTAAAERSEGTYSKYTELDDKMIPLHFYCMHAKFGIGRAMYDAAQETRTGKIDRDEGVALVRKFDGEYPSRWLPELLEYFDLTQEEFDDTVDRFRPPHLWHKVDGKWALKTPIE